MHGQDYLVYAYLQLDQDKNARAVIDDMVGTTFNPDAFVALFALAASSARYMVERDDWKGAAELQVRPTKFLHVMAITHFARALGAARLLKLQGLLVFGRVHTVADADSSGDRGPSHALIHSHARPAKANQSGGTPCPQRCR